MQGYTVQEIATALGAEAFGAVDLLIAGATEPGLAGPDDLAMAMDARYVGKLADGQAQVAVLAVGTDWQALGLKAAILVGRPRVAMSGVTRMLDAAEHVPVGIHSSSVIDSSATIGDGARIGAFVVISADAVIGANAQIASHSHIGPGVRIGDNALLQSGVRIVAGAQIGNGFIAHPGVVIGGDGFSFVTPEKSGVERARESLGDQGDAHAQSWMRIHSIGGVEIGDDVEIGANSTIDQGTIRTTQIGNGTKIDSQVQVGHNVVIGNDCLLCGQVGVAGSAVIGNNVVLGGQSGVADNITVGEGVIAGGGTKILANAPAGRVLLGYPAMKMDQQVESYKALRRLPRLVKEIRKLQETVSKIRDND